MLNFIKNVILFYVLSNNVLGQIPSIGLELTIQGHIKIINWKYNSNIDYSGDSVYYSSAEKPNFTRKERLDEGFNRRLTILESSSKQLSNIAYLESEDQIIIRGTPRIDLEELLRKKSSFDSLYSIALSNSYMNRVPMEGQDKFQDFFWPYNNLSKAEISKVRSLLRNYVYENQLSQNPKKARNELFHILTGRGYKESSSEKTESYALEDIVVYEYSGDTLKGVISFSKDWSVVQYDQFYYNVLGQLILFNRKSIGMIEETSLLFYYDEKGRVVNVSSLKNGYRKEQYHKGTLFSFSYYDYDANGTLKKIWTGDQDSASVVINRFVLR